jgi:hypothetical protein
LECEHTFLGGPANTVSSIKPMQHYSRKILSRRDYSEFESKTVLILGGANGVGAALVEAF